MAENPESGRFENSSHTQPSASRPEEEFDKPDGKGSGARKKETLGLIGAGIGILAAFFSG